MHLNQEERSAEKWGESCAIHLSNAANVVLLISKVYASIVSKSLAIIASTMDSLLDLLSGVILWWTVYSMKNLNKYLYPIGKKRRQPLVSIEFLRIVSIKDHRSRTTLDKHLQVYKIDLN